MPTLRLGSTAPDFEAETSKGPIKFHEWIGDSWVLAWISHSSGRRSPKIYCNARPSFFRTPMTSPRCALPNLRKFRSVRPISKSAMSRSLGCLRTTSNRTTSGSRTLTSGEKLTSSIPLYASSDIVPCWSIFPHTPHRSPILTGRLRRFMICSTTRMRATSTRRAYLLL
jgi:hypothetical protein